MGSCPKCNSPIEQDSLLCPKCGFDLVEDQPKGSSDTLDAGEYFSLDEPVNSASEDDIVPASEVAKVEHDTLEASLEALSSDVQPEALGSVAQDKTASEDSGVPKAEIPGDDDAVTQFLAEGDNLGTVVLPMESISNIQNTAAYSDSDLREALDSKGTSKGSGQIFQLWEDAIGSSKDPYHSMRGPDALASDSIFKRVAVRKVAQANAPSDSGADYVIVNRVGKGGMGIVYSARQTNVDRLVALKAINASMQADDSNRRKFFYEAQITADLDHPNIVPIYEMGTSEDGLLFYTMKLITGTEWKEVFDQKTRDENLDILSKVSDAVAFAHSKGIIHRDLKPANTMLGPFGEVYVTDWGVAVDLKKNQSFSLGGTAIYMAPEMARHQVSKIGNASDIYLLGALLFEIVTGKPPHPVQPPQAEGLSDSQKRALVIRATLAAAAENRIVDFDGEDVLLPIAHRAMETDPEKRFRSVEAFQAAVRECRKHDESSNLAKRCHALLDKAIEQKNYDLFTQSIYGYKTAIETWPENEIAIHGLSRAQLEYGKCAVAKGDYGQAMQWLDRSDREQADVYAQAVKGKSIVDGRAARIKNMWRAFTAIVLAFLAISSTLAVFAFVKMLDAEHQKEIADEEKKQARLSENNAIKAATAAEKAKNQAEFSQLESDVFRYVAEGNESIAIRAKRDAEQASKDAIFNAEAADFNKLLAEINANATEVQRKIAVQEKANAEQQTIRVQIGDYQSKLALSKAQLESFDLKGSRDTLTPLESIEIVGAARNPKFDTWPWQRIKLLTNDKLRKVQLAAEPTALATSIKAHRGVVGTANGEVRVVHYVNDVPEVERTHVEAGARIEAVAISPDGDEVVFAFLKDGKHGLRVWPREAKEPLPVKATADRSLQGLAYSPDGSYLVAGINQGVWLWKRTRKWYEEARPSQQYLNVRGKLKSLDVISESKALIGSDLRTETQTEVLLYEVNLNGSESTAIKLPESLKNVITAIAYDSADRKVVLGTSTGQLYSAEILGAKEIGNPTEILPIKHGTEIRHIVTTEDGQMLTTGAAEPVSHVWRLNDAKLWNHDSELLGIVGNFSNAEFIGPRDVLGVAKNGELMVWDVERQKQIKRLVRKSEDGTSDEKYAAPVIGVFGSGEGRTLAIDAYGIVDLWNMNDGRTIQIDKERWSYIGHTPGADFVDSAIDAESGVIVTSARLRNAEKQYLKRPDDQWEFCLWDQKTGNMLRRWTSQSVAPLEEKVDPSAEALLASARRFSTKPKAIPTEKETTERTAKRGAIEQRVSIVDQGQAIILSSDYETLLVDRDGKKKFQSSDFGTYFAIPNPRTPNIVMLVMRSGALRILDLKNLAAWSNGPKEFGLTTTSDTPIQGVWSPSGNRFYLTFTSGALASIGWEKGKLGIVWSSHQLDGEKETKELQDMLASDAIRVKSHADIDMTVREAGAQQKLYIARRARGAKGQTALATIQFPERGQPKLVASESDKRDGIYWLDEKGATPKLSDQIHKQFLVDSSQIAARRQVGEFTYVTTRSANVFRFTEGEQKYASFARQKVLEATANKEGSIVIVLLEDGSLWRFELTNTLEASWRPCTFAIKGAKQITMSPYGGLLAIVTEGEGVSIRDVESGGELRKIKEAVVATWDPKAGKTLAEQTLAVCTADGEILTSEGNQEPKLLENLAKVEKVDGEKVVGLHYFTESFEKGEELRSFLVQSENTVTGYVQIVPMEPLAKEVNENGVEITKRMEEKVELGTRIALSPNEGVFATGDRQGTVAVWFATVAENNKPRRLYELEGHRGAEVKVVTFSEDGSTLISSDSKNRLFGWLSTESTKSK